jgi:uncharacterized Fe-S cluster protein YjdI
METYDHKFTNGAITVTYDPDKCIHSEICARGLQEVFRTTVIPWIHLEGAESERIIDQVRKCPSGALQVSCHKMETIK